MKLVYMCRTGFKNGALREWPLTENGGWGWGGLSERPFTGKTGTFETNNSNETCIFLRRGSFQFAQVGKAEQRIV